MLNFLLDNGWHIEVAFKLIIAATLSLVIGIERELKKKPVDLKTVAIMRIRSYK